MKKVFIKICKKCKRPFATEYDVNYCANCFDSDTAYTLGDTIRLIIFIIFIAAISILVC